VKSDISSHNPAKNVNSFLMKQKLYHQPSGIIDASTLIKDK
jgi:hypothetical protein